MYNDYLLDLGRSFTNLQFLTPLEGSPATSCAPSINLDDIPSHMRAPLTAQEQNLSSKIRRFTDATGSLTLSQRINI